jgi:hypothetical protein
MVSVGFMVFMISFGPSYHASRGSRPTLLRSIDLVLFNPILRYHLPKEDYYPPATMKRDHHGGEGLFLGFPMGSGGEHLCRATTETGGTLYLPICSETRPLGPSGYLVCARRTLLSLPSTFAGQGAFCPHLVAFFRSL